MNMTKNIKGFRPFVCGRIVGERTGAFDVSVMNGHASNAETAQLHQWSEDGKLRYVVRSGPYPILWASDDAMVLTDASYGASFNLDRVTVQRAWMNL